MDPERRQDEPTVPQRYRQRTAVTYSTWVLSYFGRGPKLCVARRCATTVPANGCLAHLALGSQEQIARCSSILSIERFGSPLGEGNFRFPLTRTYLGCPQVPSRGSPRSKCLRERMCAPGILSPCPSALR